MSKSNIALSEAIKNIGSQKKLASKVGVVQSCVWKWLHGKTKLPLDMAINIEQLTNGAVTCEELRPDVNWSVLRKQKSH